MTTTLGKVERVDLAIYQGSDLNFDVSWYADDQTTPINISAVQAQIRESVGGTVLLDLDDYITVADNVAHVSVPASRTIELEPRRRAFWDLDATASDSGEVKKLMRGIVSIFAEVSTGSSS